MHDLSHPIQNIGNSCKLIVKMFDDLEYRESFKRTVEREFEQVKRVLDDLRNVARPNAARKVPARRQQGADGVVESMLTRPNPPDFVRDRFVFGPLCIEGDLFALTASIAT